MWGELLCKLGLHDWLVFKRWEASGDGRQLVRERDCSRCGKREVDVLYTIVGRR